MPATLTTAARSEPFPPGPENNSINEPRAWSGNTEMPPMEDVLEWAGRLEGRQRWARLYIYVSTPYRGRALGNRHDEMQCSQLGIWGKRSAQQNARKSVRGQKAKKAGGDGSLESSRGKQ